jgi:hypothetical protein
VGGGGAIISRGVQVGRRRRGLCVRSTGQVFMYVERYIEAIMKRLSVGSSATCADNVGGLWSYDQKILLVRTTGKPLHAHTGYRRH